MGDISNFIMSHLYWFWLGVLILMLLAEAATAALVTVWCALSAFVMIFLSLTEMPFRWQLLLFFIFSALLIIFTRPLAVKKFRLGKVRTNADALVGQDVLVTSDIRAFAKGTARASDGMEWSAAAQDGDEILRGDICTVVSIKGNTLIVKKK